MSPCDNCKLKALCGDDESIKALVKLKNLVDDVNDIDSLIKDVRDERVLKKNIKSRIVDVIIGFLTLAFIGFVGDSIIEKVKLFFQK
jgi:hypothetical protein